MSGPKITSEKVAVYRNHAKSVVVNSAATDGAQIGTNLYNADGSVVTQAQWNALKGSGQSTTTFSATTDQVDEGEFNLYFTDRRAQDAVGSILANSANVTLAYVGGTSITANLTPVTL